MKIEIVYALKNEQFFYTEEVEEGTTVGEALASSQLLKEFPNLDISKVGIFSQAAKKEDELNENDRIEIYRPLLVDPKAKRRERAKT
jgi:putative ubiquitin-RnfH superfamily antitoxin RatB of RatAB toxin-antitoxin module